MIPLTGGWVVPNSLSHGVFSGLMQPSRGLDVEDPVCCGNTLAGFRKDGLEKAKKMGLAAAAARASPAAQTGSEAGTSTSPPTELFVQLPGGGKMPASGLGTCCRANAYEYESVYRQVLHYFLLGGRHIDT